MALLKQITSPEGIVTNYHRIENVSLDGNNLSCMIDSYVSKEYRKLEKPAERFFFDFEITIEEEESMGIRQLAYSKIKALPNWADAEDC